MIGSIQEIPKKEQKIWLTGNRGIGNMRTSWTALLFKRSVAQLGSASGLGPEGRGFESLHSDHFLFEPIVKALDRV